MTPTTMEREYGWTPDGPYTPSAIVIHDLAPTPPPLCSECGAPRRYGVVCPACVPDVTPSLQQEAAWRWER